MVARICILAVLLAGCGGTQFGINGSTAPTIVRSSGATQGAGRGDLLYVSDYIGHAGQVLIFSFPSGKRLATISGFGPTSPCSDASGNVWVPGYVNERASVYKFAHGGTKPIAKIVIPHRYGALACAVDPTTGDLAVAGLTSINVFPSGISGTPIHYDLGYVSPRDCAYDPQGNLYFDGAQGSTAFYLLAELTKGSSKFQYFSLNKRAGFYPTGLIWDGQHMAVEGFPGKRTQIYRFDVSGKKGDVVQIVRATDLSRHPWFAVLGNELVGMANKYGTGVQLWKYPQGGPAIAKFSHHFTDIQGMTISVAQ